MRRRPAAAPRRLELRAAGAPRPVARAVMADPPGESPRRAHPAASTPRPSCAPSPPRGECRPRSRAATQEPAKLRSATARAGKGRTKEVPGSSVALDELPQRKVSKKGVPDGDVALRGSPDETPKTFLQRDHVLPINVNSYGSDRERRVLLQAKVERLAEQQSWRSCIPLLARDARPCLLSLRQSRTVRLS